MDFMPHLDQFSMWLMQYGSFALFGLLALGIIALPIPEETLMILSGFLMSQGKLEIPQTILAAMLGSICGITGSYLIGRTIGIYFVHKYGKWIGIKQEHVDKVHEWFEKYGKWTLLVGYFIPGVRHLTGISAGTTNLSVHHFTLFAYMGAIIWVSTFLSIGYFFGDHWLTIYDYVESKLDYLVHFLLTVALAGLALYIYSKVKQSK